MDGDRLAGPERTTLVGSSIAYREDEVEPWGLGGCEGIPALALEPKVWIAGFLEDLKSDRIHLARWLTSGAVCLELTPPAML